MSTQTSHENIANEKSRTADRTPRRASESQRLLTMRQIEEIYGLPWRSVYDLHVRGTLPTVQFPGSRRLWFKREAVEELIDRSTEGRKA